MDLQEYVLQEKINVYHQNLSNLYQLFVEMNLFICFSI